MLFRCPRIPLCRSSSIPTSKRCLNTQARPSKRPRHESSPSSERTRSPSSYSRFSSGEHVSHSPKSPRAGTDTSSRPRWAKDTVAPPRGDPSSLPRYIRRAAANASPDPKSASKATTSTEPRFRSRNYDPSGEKSSTMRLLEPHILSGRLKKLAEVNQLDTAVAMLKNAPLAAQNTPVWNTLIWECMKAKRFKLAYDLFVDMKRRGFKPTTRTFQTMFSGLSRIEVWSAYPQQLKNARSLYDAYQRHIETVKKNNPTSSELSIDPLPAYITILGNAGQFEEIFVLYYSLVQEGPLAANKFLFTAMFRALSVNTAGLTAAQYAKNATDAKVLWGEVLKASEKPGIEIDSFVVTAAVIALSKGESSEQDLAFQLVREYFGLAASTESPVHGKMSLSSQSLAAALLLCNNSHKPAECIHFFQQVMKRPEASGGADIIDRAHGEEVLKARLAAPAPLGSAQLSVETLEWMLRQELQGANGSKVRPAISTYNLVLLACWRRVDWTSATRTFNLMTGYHCHDFMDGAVLVSPRVDKRPKGRNLLPTAETMSCMLRTALATKDCANMRQSLRIAAHFNKEASFFAENKKQLVNESTKTVKHWAFHVIKLAAAVVETVNYIAANGTRPPIEVEMAQWNKLKQAALQLLAKTPDPAADDFVPKAPSSATRERARPLTKYEMSYGV
ncbi:pentatricopeptide repeat-containing protein [Mycena maculata]|uniref:Pentatricopeptide repeat-containing protein n=1 Tax=Mycena maculata TaxID=230809 RepID=A0AAD7JT17_9AGAR|nr:pentatricopeptide repeat-containing protein [Mycena maculata]